MQACVYNEGRNLIRNGNLQRIILKNLLLYKLFSTYPAPSGMKTNHYNAVLFFANDALVVLQRFHHVDIGRPLNLLFAQNLVLGSQRQLSHASFKGTARR